MKLVVKLENEVRTGRKRLVGLRNLRLELLELLESVERLRA